MFEIWQKYCDALRKRDKVLAREIKLSFDELIKKKDSIKDEKEIEEFLKKSLERSYFVDSKFPAYYGYLFDSLIFPYLLRKVKNSEKARLWAAQLISFIYKDGAKFRAICLELDLENRDEFNEEFLLDNNSLIQSKKLRARVAYDNIIRALHQFPEYMDDETYRYVLKNIDIVNENDKDLFLWHPRIKERFEELFRILDSWKKYRQIKSNLPFKEFLASDLGDLKGW